MPARHFFSQVVEEQSSETPMLEKAADKLFD